MMTVTWPAACSMARQAASRLPPPNSASPVPLLVDMDVGRTVFTFILMGLVGTLAAYMPARRAAKKDIIDALGHV